MKRLLMSAFLGGIALLAACGTSRDSARETTGRPASSPTSANQISANQLPKSTTTSPRVQTNSLPESFASVLPEIKARSHIPVLLPGELPDPIATATHALVDKAEASEYAISLYYELGIGNAGFAAFFSAQADPTYYPQDLGNIDEVKLSGDTRGYFSPVSCGGSCGPANLWWEGNGVLYQIQLRLNSRLSPDDQQKTIAKVADSSIVAGPR